MQAPRARDAAARPRPPEPRPGQPHHNAGERTSPVRPPPSYRRPPPYEDAAERALPVRPPPPSRPVPPPPYYDEEERVLPVRPPSPSRRVVLPPYYEAAERGLPLPVRGRSSSSALASCLMAAAFLLLAVGGAGTALFLLFRPHPPDIAVEAVRLPAFAAANGTVAFTFEQRATVRNPNRAPLAHFDSSLRVAYAGGELGSVYIPAGLIDSGSTKDMSASFVVPAFAAATPLPPQQEQIAASAQQLQQQPPVMEVDSLLVVKGKVTVLHVLTHRVEASKVCRVGVSPLDGRVLGFRC